MPRQAQGFGASGARAAGGVTDWQALELQLSRTRVLLQEILVHLQEVLKSLRTTRPGATGFAGRPESAGARPGATGANARHRAQTAQAAGASDRFSAGRAQSAAGASATGTSERFRHKARPHHETHCQGAGPSASPNAGQSEFGARAAAGAGAGSRERATGPGAAFNGSTAGRAGTASAGTDRTGQSTFRAQAGTHRERPRPEGNFRAQAAGPQAEARTESRTHFRQQPGFAGTSAGSAGRDTAREASAGQGTAGAGASSQQRTAGASSQHRTAGNASQSRTTGASSQSRATGAAGQSRSTGASRPHARPRPERTAQGFRPDDDRQHRAREIARRSGMNLKCAYEILCLDYPCSVDEIKNAYRHMARLHHPDLGGDEEAMKDVNVAYEMAMRFSAGRRTATAWAV
ncbi:DnaJ domain-containing protein [Solidesulfovibrio carbinolicus]|uniref:Molecular chaperone DnaJ n=1 Tax=Solidesulfovibrio carbinolicus TaxID=296842 RepID=A0A4P6HQ63_9BACT|nr:DnaJ domain-containing protein [Solidesulfovibrio carbinolicus]QAZ69265.1 molecular chaperone DnaJ [Solidesulfovibrio carbinolicus]